MSSTLRQRTQKGILSVTKLEAFKQEFRHRVEALPGISSVEFIGSMARGDYVPGTSDLDVFVHGHKIPRQSKKQAIALVRGLSMKHELGLERASYQYPTPFFIDTRLRKELYRSFKGRMELHWLRTVVKKAAPSYHFMWRLQQRKEE